MQLLDQLTRSNKVKLTRFARDVLAWWRCEARDFPWRSGTASLYEKIVVEVLLQRTSATAVAQFYDAFFQRYPSWEELSGARIEELEEFLKPLGLWRRRANSLLGLAAYAYSKNGHFPRDSDEHKEIPAVGQYVSNAILMFQHGQRTPLLDVNMARAIERVVRPRRLADLRHDPWLQEASAYLVRGPQPEQTNWAILDFAAVVCKSRSPSCAKCPVNRYCSFFKSFAGKLR